MHLHPLSFQVSPAITPSTIIIKKAQLSTIPRILRVSAVSARTLSPLPNNILEHSPIPLSIPCPNHKQQHKLNAKIPVPIHVSRSRPFPFPFTYHVSRFPICVHLRVSAVSARTLPPPPNNILKHSSILLSTSCSNHKHHHN